MKCYESRINGARACAGVRSVKALCFVFGKGEHRDK